MAGENEKIILDVKDAVDTLRETVEKYGAESAEYKEMVEKTQEALEKDEKAHSELMAKQAESDKKTLELEDRVKEFEARMAEHQSQKKEGTNYKDEAEYKALSNYFRFGEKELSDEDFDVLKKNNKTMRMDDDTQGGYLTTTEFDATIIKKITEISPVRQHARVRTVSRKTLEMPTRATIPEATYEGEAASGDDGNSTYGAESLTCYRLTITVPFTMDVLMDASFDLEAEISGDVTEGMAKKEGNKFVLGTGAKQPEGFLSYADLAFLTTAGSLTISGDDLLLLTGELKSGYNPMYGFNRRTLAFIRTLKGSDGQYLWQTSLAPGAPNTIAGEPYDVFPDMPAYNVANNLSVIYADFKRGYTITDRVGMSIIRDQYAKKRQAIIETTFHRWNTGGVTLPEAFVALKTKS